VKEAILGIDVGTSSTKAILFDLAGNELTSAAQSYPLLTPQPGWVNKTPKRSGRRLSTFSRILLNNPADAGSYLWQLLPSRLDHTG